VDDSITLGTEMAIVNAVISSLKEGKVDFELVVQGALTNILVC
jgi:hypothetical protein